MLLLQTLWPLGLPLRSLSRKAADCAGGSIQIRTLCFWCVRLQFCPSMWKQSPLTSQRSHYQTTLNTSENKKKLQQLRMTRLPWTRGLWRAARRSCWLCLLFVLIFLIVLSSPGKASATARSASSPPGATFLDFGNVDPKKRTWKKNQTEQLPFSAELQTPPSLPPPPLPPLQTAQWRWGSQGC